MSAHFRSKGASLRTALAAAPLLAACVLTAPQSAKADEGEVWLARALAAQNAEGAESLSARSESAGAEAWAPKTVAGGLRPAWMEERFSLSIQDHPLPEVLSEFAAAAGAPLRVGEEVPQNARVSGRFENVAGAEFLDRVARDHGLDWRYDGGMIEVSSISERVTRLVGLRGVSIIDLERAMRRLGIWEDKFRPKVVDGAIAHMNGPPRYVAAMETVLEEMVVNRDAVQAEAAAARERAEARAAEAQAQAQARAAEAKARAEAEAANRAWRAAQPPRVVRGGAWN